MAPKINSSSSSASPHYKLNIRPTSKCRPIALTSHKDKTKLFEGLDDSVSGNESFVPRKSLKQLTIKPRAPPSLPLPDSTSPPFTQAPVTINSSINNISSPLSSTSPSSAFPLTPILSTKKNESLESPELGLGGPYTNSIQKPIPV